MNELPKIIQLTETEIQALLAQAAEHGAKQALANVGLDGEHAHNDVRDLRTLLRAIHQAKKTVWQTTIRVMTTSLLALIIAGLAIKLKWIGG